MPFFVQDGGILAAAWGNAGLELALHSCVVLVAQRFFESGLGSKALFQHPL